MKIITKKDRIIIYINKLLIDFNLVIKEEIEDFVKRLVIKLKKYKISGFYKVDVYQNDNYGLIIDMKKQDSFDFFPELIDLKLYIYYDSEFYLKIEDYFLVKDIKDISFLDGFYYVKVNNLSDLELLSLVEFGEILYGKEVNNLIYEN